MPSTLRRATHGVASLANGVAGARAWSTGGDGTPTPAQDDWFAWCQRCKHGGHAGHLAQWFSSHSKCAVVECQCNCNE